MKFIAIKLIRLYQIFLSPFIGQNCRYHPKCSNYTIIAIERFGFWNGSILGFKRIWRCRPGGGHGNDPVPKEL